MSQRLGSFSSDLVMTQSEALIKGDYMFSYILGIKQLQIKELRHDQMLKTCIDLSKFFRKMALKTENWLKADLAQYWH